MLGATDCAVDLLAFAGSVHTRGCLGAHSQGDRRAQELSCCIRLLISQLFLYLAFYVDDEIPPANGPKIRERGP